MTTKNITFLAFAVSSLEYELAKSNSKVFIDNVRVPKIDMKKIPLQAFLEDSGSN